MSDSRPETYEHAHQVQILLAICIKELLDRQLGHDRTKLFSPEKEAYDGLGERLHGLEYGSAEYRAVLRAMKPAIRHHTDHNKHHPEWQKRDEVWMPVVDYQGHYEVSNFGEVRALERIVERSGKQGDLKSHAKTLKPHLTPKGYLRLQLAFNGKKENHYVHVLVARAFIPEPEGDVEVNHKNGIKTDNRSTNLEWLTPSANQKHAYDTGLKTPTVKYVVTCVEYDITTFGIEKMVSELRKRGHSNASSGSIWACIAGDSSSHLGLHFTSVNLEEYKPPSQLTGMSLIDLLEMLCDWLAASKRGQGNSLRDAMDHNQERWRFSDELKEILLNTLEFLEES